MERVAFLIEETGERIACLLNPESVVVRRVAGVRPRRSLGGSLTGSQLADDALLFTGGGMTEVFLNLLFDINIPGTLENIKDVRDLTSPLWKLSENTNEANIYGEPSHVRFVWGKSWNIPGVISKVSEHFDYFDKEGNPLRSWLRMRFLRVVEPLAEDIGTAPPLVQNLTGEQLEQEAQKALENPIGENKIHTYNAGERLDQLVRQQYGYYGHPGLWRLIATYNSIDDPLNIPAGTILQFPPLSIIEGKK
jgi:hypothetical protein